MMNVASKLILISVLLLTGCATVNLHDESIAEANTSTISWFIMASMTFDLQGMI
jgi:uncharacterized protein YceK